MTPKPRHSLTPPPPSGGHPLLRRVVSGLSAGILAAGVLAGTAASSLPGTPGTRTADGAPALAASAPVGETAAVSIGLVGGSVTSVPETLDQIFALLERAERAAHDSGREITPAISQAAAELGMLLTTYLAQHDDVAATVGDDADLATAAAAVAGVTLPEPVAPRPTTDPGAADEVAAGNDVATDDAAGDAASDGVAAAAADDDVADAAAAADAAADSAADAAADSDAADAAAAAADSEAADAAAADSDSDAADAEASDLTSTADELPEVTFDDVVLAAMRLATLLDAEGVYRVAVSGVAPLASEDTPLTTMLRDAVERYGRSTDGYANGRIPADVLCALPFAPGHRLRCDAAAQLVALNTAYEAKFGRSIPMTDSYRTLESQIVLKERKPRLAAVPGHSLHGWGIAVDLAAPISSGTSREYLWLRLNGPDYGWDNPSWARLDGSKPEPWHFEFFAAGPMPDRALSAEDVALYRAASSRPTGSTTQQSTTPAATPDATDAPTPSSEPTPTPSSTPTPTPSNKPSPSGKPTPTPSNKPTPSSKPTPTPSNKPTPSTTPTPTPSTTPTDPAADPTEDPSTDPTTDPTPSTDPTGQPTTDPATDGPADEPTGDPSGEPTTDPATDDPTDEPTGDPSGEPSDEPTADPGETPACEAAEEGSGDAADEPAVEPTCDSDQAGETPVDPGDNPTDPAADSAGDPTDSATEPAGDPVTDPAVGQDENPTDVGLEGPPSDVATTPEPATTPTRDGDDPGEDPGEDPDTPDNT